MKTKKPNRRRVRRARPLLIAIGAVLLAGCGAEQGTTPDQGLQGIPALVDMGLPAGDQ